MLKKKIENGEATPVEPVIKKVKKIKYRPYKPVPPQEFIKTTEVIEKISLNEGIAIDFSEFSSCNENEYWTVYIDKNYDYDSCNVDLYMVKYGKVETPVPNYKTLYKNYLIQKAKYDEDIKIWNKQQAEEKQKTKDLIRERDLQLLAELKRKYGS